MKKFKYKIETVQFRVSRDQELDYLNALGTNGWELIKFEISEQVTDKSSSTLDSFFYPAHTYYFKKEIEYKNLPSGPR